MFSFKPKHILILAVISGLLGSYLVYKYLQQKRAEQPEEKSIAGTRMVVVASRDLPVGTTLNPANIEVKPWPVEVVPAGSVENMNELVDRVIKIETFAGEPILLSKLAPQGAVGGVSSLIPTGMRAITVAVNVVSGVSGFILPNTRVDILATFTESDKDKSITKIVLQDVIVLAIDQIYDKDDTDPAMVKSVTLLLTPEDSEKLALASIEGKLQMALRNSADSDIYDTDGVRLAELIGTPRPVVRPRRTAPRRTTPPPVQTSTPPPPPQKTARVVEIIRSNKREEATFEQETETEQE